MSKGTVQAKTLTQGQTIHIVNRPGYDQPPWMKSVVVRCRPLRSRYVKSSPYILVDRLPGKGSDPKGIAVMEFLGDDNIYPYKNLMEARHKVFYSKRKAVRYLKQATSEYNREMLHKLTGRLPSSRLRELSSANRFASLTCQGFAASCLNVQDIKA